MLFGTYEHSLDDKNRLMIPSKIRSELQNSVSLYVLKGFDGCLSIYTEEHFNKLISKLEAYSFFNKDARDFVRMTLASVTQMNIDKVGRIQFSPAILTKYSISKSVVVIGVYDHIEVWDKEAYQNYLNNKESLYEDIADKLDKTNE